MNDFQILCKLGEGAYSVVYKVKRMTDGGTYALKKVKLGSLSEKEKQNALNEVRILASVKSSFVVTYKEAFYEENEQCLCIVMEYANKGDLYQKICEFKKAGVYFEESDIFRIFIQIARGLKALHDMKILHRDLKSANVFLYNDGSAKLGDLNVSKVARRGLGYTQTGTPYYASPEVWKDQPYDSKSDIWSLGCVLYEMITLRPPFRAENMEGLYNKVIKGQYSKIPEKFSSDLVEMVKFLLQVHPENRPTADQILKNPIIQKRMEFFKTYSDDMHFDNNLLLQTIKIPKNLLFLTDRLPQANYEKNNVNMKNKEDVHKKIDKIEKIEKERRESLKGSLERREEKEKPTEEKEKEKEVVAMKMKSDNNILERIKIVDKEKEKEKEKIKIAGSQKNLSSVIKNSISSGIVNEKVLK